MLQQSLWGDVPATPAPKRERRNRCYLCGETAEGYCEECHRPVCYPCGATWGTIHGRDEYACQYGDTCASSRRGQWYRQCNLVRGLLGYDGDDEYPHDILREFIDRHMVRWQWAIADEWHPWHCTSREDKADMLKAVRTARRILGLNNTRGAA